MDGGEGMKESEALVERVWTGMRERIAASTVVEVMFNGISSREEVGWDIAVIAGLASKGWSSSIASASDNKGRFDGAVGVVMYTLLLVLTWRMAHTLSLVQRWRYSSFDLVPVLD